MKPPINDDSICDECAELEKAFAALLRKNPRGAFNWAMIKALDIVQAEPKMPVGFFAPFIGTIKTVGPFVSEQGETEVPLPSGKVARIRALPVDAVEDLKNAPERLTRIENRLEVARFRARFPVTHLLPTEGAPDSSQPAQGAPLDTLPLGESAPVTGAIRGVDGEPIESPEGDQ